MKNVALAASNSATVPLPSPYHFRELRPVGQTAKEVLERLDAAGVEVSDWVRGFLEHEEDGSYFSGADRIEELVVLHVGKDLGCRKPSTRSLLQGLRRRGYECCKVDDVFAAVCEFGGFLLSGDFVIFATGPLDDGGGVRGMPVARRDKDGGPWNLDAELADDSDKWPTNAYVVCRPASLA